MKKIMLQGIENRNGINLDPRTKLLLIFTITTVVIGGGNNGYMTIVKPVLCFIPFILLIATHNFKGGLFYLGVYTCAYMAEIFIVPNTMGLFKFLILAISGMLSRFMPGIMMGYFLISTTTVSEFVAAMERMHLPMAFIIPMSVIFRFFPTIGEEYFAINDAMKMRGIRLGGGKPSAIMEYRLVPLITSTVKIGEELSAAALTRGLGKPIRRTNICKIGFSGMDFIFIFLCLIGWIIFIASKIGY
jgi:energy-coupling factor transport system permease protein